jgi:hypothetical protein
MAEALPDASGAVELPELLSVCSGSADAVFGMEWKPIASPESA